MFYEIEFVKDNSLPSEFNVYLWDTREALL